MQTLQNYKEEGGFAILSILIAIALFALIGVTMVRLGAANQMMRTQQMRKYQIFACAQAGFDLGRGYKKHVSSFSSLTRHLNRCTIQIVKNGANYDVTVTRDGITSAYQVKRN